MLSKSRVQASLPPQTRATKFLLRTFVLLSFFALSFVGAHIADPPAPAVITELRCDDGAGTTAADASGNAHPGTLTNGPTWNAGKWGQGVNLDGTNDYINLADHADYTLTPTVSYTWSGWVRNNNFNQWSTIWSQTLNSSNFFYFYAHSSTDAEAGPVTNGISVYWYSGSNKLVLHSNNNVLATGTWSYVTITYNASVAQTSRFTIYVNGADVTNRTDVVSTGTIAAIDPTNIRVGSNQPFGEYLNGSVDEIRYYRRLLSVAEIQSDMNIGNTPDVTFPTVNITAPAAGNVSATINVSANANDNTGVVGVQFLLDGNNLGAEDITSPYSVSWNTTTATNGNHNLTARARDAAGNITTSATVAVNVNNIIDTELPTVSVNAPATSPVAGTINVDATANDNIGVLGVQFLLDGVNLGAEDVTAPYSVSWNTTTVTNDAHNLTAKARDAAGNTATSAATNFTVFNNNLVASYGFNENTGTTANDNSGNGNTGTLTNGPAWSPSGKYGAAILFDGTNDFVNINDANALDLTNGMTIEAWVNGSNLTGYKTAICKENGTNNLSYALSPNNNTSGVANQRPNARIRIGTTTTTVTGTTKLALNTWIHVASTYDGAVLRLYINGVQVSTANVTGNMGVSANALRIGGSTALAQYFTGLIDEVRIYNRALSQVEIQTDMNTPIAPDVTNPSTNVTAPADNSTVAGTINVTANASDNTGVVGVQFLVDGNNLGAEDLTAPYSVSWNTTTPGNGNHTLTARARDVAGNNTTSTGVVVLVDNLAPTINLTAPAAGTIAGIVDINADANDNNGVVGVQFLLNGNNLGSEDQVAPYSFSWNTNTVTDGSYTLTAKARDAAGNITTSAGVIVNILNHPPDSEFPTISITSPVTGEVVGTVNITADANDNVAVAGVQFLLNGNNLGTEDAVAPYSFSWNTMNIANGTYTLTAKARDAANNITTSTDVVVTVNNPPDTEFPTVSIIEPGAGTISGIVNLVASANDNVGIIGVQFLLDGNNLGAEDLIFPYSFSWNTSTVGNGIHTISARTRDAAGNVTTSAGVDFTINNDVQAPTVNITSPTGGTVLGTNNITADANDNVAVVGVQFLLNGSLLGAEDVSAPYSISWNTLTATNGTYNLTAKARDAAGNITISSPIVVTVSNVTNLITAIHFNEGTATNATDVSGKNHNGTLTGGATWSPGKYGQAVNLNGSNNYVNIADHADYTLNPAQNYTWSAWVKNNNFNEWSTVWSQALNTTTFFYFYAHTTSQTDGGGGPVTNGVAVYWFSGTSKLALHSNNNVLIAGQWSHITITYDASQAQANRFTIYVNGADVTNRTAVGSTGTITAIDPTGIRIGSNSAFGEYLNGAVDELRFYNRLLTSTEIQADMNTAVEIDNTAPVVNITSPANSSNVAGNVTVTANATDNVGVAGVQFMLDGVNLDVEDNTAPYSITWNSQLGSNGAHVLSARARDAKGNTATSTNVNVNVVPDFLFTVLTPAKNVEQTGNTDFRIYVSYLNGYTTTGVNLSVTGLPPNSDGHFLFNPMSHQGETQLIINTTNAPIGTYPLTLTATAFDGTTHSQPATLTVTTASDFAITAAPSIANVSIGNAVSFTINVNETNDYVNPVTLSVTGLPTGVTATFNPPSPIPAATSTLTFNVSNSAVAGTYNLTVNGTSGATVRTVGIQLIISSTPSVWTISTIGTTGTPNNCVRVGALKPDGLERIYIGTIGTGHMLEYAWNGTAFTGPVDVGGSPTGTEIHDCNIGDARGDGKDRLYAASYDFNIYEIWNDATGWHQMVVGALNGNLGMHMAMGDGRNDGVTRLYAASTQQLFEFTWNGTSWTKLLIGTTPGAHGVAIGKPRGDGKNYIYIASISSGDFEVYWNGTSWVINSMGDSGDSRGVGLGDGRNDGKTRVYVAVYDGTMREFTWTGTAWTFVNLPNTGIQNVHAYIIPGRNDGVNRLYTDNGNGKCLEYTWNGTGWTTYNMGGGSDYMYGLHWGHGRNDGLIRLYSTDRGSVNRVYELTWTVPIIAYIKEKDDGTLSLVMKR
jgi:hypothetical protein